MAKLLISWVALIVVLGYASGLNLSCPPSNKMTSCSPKCKDDYECSGQKCCPNICNAKSCTTGNQASSASDQGYKNPSKSATGSYCGNVKCSSYEKCELDRASKRQKCVRT